MATLETYRLKPGTRLRRGELEIMVIELCAGMIPQDVYCTPNGGKDTVPVVSLETGRTSFWDASMEVREMDND